MLQKAGLLIALALLPATAIHAQSKPIVKFAETEFNFGTVKENAGYVTCEFAFTNYGKSPLIINEVKSSCGCAVPEWTRQPVLPGKSDTLRVCFNPQRQSGAITTTIQVNSNAETPQAMLLIRGVVIPTQQMEEVYRYTIGDLRLQTIYATFGEIVKGKTGHYSIRIMNRSDSLPASVTFRKIPPHLGIRVVPETLEPGQEGTIEIEYRTATLSNWDYAVDRLDLLISGKAVANNRINITAIIKEDFSQLSAEDLANAARAEFDSREHNFGTITDKEVVEHSFKLTNTGKSNLYIRKVSASCGCTAVQPEKTTIAPGDTTVIRAVFNTAGREGNQKKAITVITNDPRQSRTVLWINAVIRKQSTTRP